MLLIADSGSTKTAWRLIDHQNRIHQFQTQGIHPLFLNEEQIQAVLQSELLSQTAFPSSHEISEIHFYGTGCSNPSLIKKVDDALTAQFDKAHIKVESDLLGAARGLCGTSPGIAIILGTGSNSCLYDGKSITHQQTSLGYILGDEGSGAWIGKNLLQRYLYNELPEVIRDSLRNRLKVDKDTVLENVYRQPFPNRYLAGFSKFVFQNIKHPEMIHLVREGFSALFDRHIRHYPSGNLPLHATGSVAFFFSSILRDVAQEKGYSTGSITENPAAGLALFHLGEI